MFRVLEGVPHGPPASSAPHRRCLNSRIEEVPVMRALRYAPLLLLLSPMPALADTIVSSNIAVNTTWGPAGNVYRITTSIAITSGVTLTIQPGVIVKFNASQSLTVNGTLSAVGTAGSNIYITSIKDDAIGGDTNGDGNATVPAAQDWGSIILPDASPANSV